MIIDSHVHISIFGDNAKTLEGAFDLLLADMEENGIDFAIVIPDNIENDNSIADLSKAMQLTKESKNIFLLGSPQIIQKGSSEVNKYSKLLKERKILGLKFFPGHDPYYPNDERCSPYYEMCQKLNVPVVFHTGENSGDSECAKFNDPKYIVEIARNFSQLKIIITHYYWPKLDYCYQLTRNVNNIYFELAAMADEEVVEKSGGIEKVREILLKTVNDRPDKVIYGTDWPMCKMKNHVDLVKSLNLEKKLEDKIFYNNSIKAYNLPL